LRQDKSDSPGAGEPNASRWKTALLLALRTPRQARPGEVNYGFVDRFTFAHFGIGLVYALLGLNFLIAILLALAWEIIENPLKAHVPSIFPHGTADTLRNSIGDTLAVLAGWWITTVTLPIFL